MTFVALAVCWPVIIRTIIEHYPVILAIVIPNLINAQLKKTLVYRIITTSSQPYGDRIVHRRWFMLWDLYQAFLSMFTGIVNAIVRMATAVVLAVVSVPRMDRSAMPAWVSRYLSIDKGLHSFNGEPRMGGVCLAVLSKGALRRLCVRLDASHVCSRVDSFPWTGAFFVSQPCCCSTTPSTTQSLSCSPMPCWMPPPDGRARHDRLLLAATAPSP